MNPLLFIVVIILIINAIFWSMYSHKNHCAFISLFGISKCPPHWIHIAFGIMCFITAVALVNI